VQSHTNSFNLLIRFELIQLVQQCHLTCTISVVCGLFVWYLRDSGSFSAALRWIEINGSIVRLNEVGNCFDSMTCIAHLPSTHEASGRVFDAFCSKLQSAIFRRILDVVCASLKIATGFVREIHLRITKNESTDAGSVDSSRQGRRALL
jgi:hypothetical protein